MSCSLCQSALVQAVKVNPQRPHVLSVRLRFGQSAPSLCGARLRLLATSGDESVRAQQLNPPKTRGSSNLLNASFFWPRLIQADIALEASWIQRGVIGATGFEPATFRSPSRRELVATVGRPLGAYPPFPASCPCSSDHSRPAPPLTDPSVRDSRT